MYVPTLFRGGKTWELEKRVCVFGHIHKFGKDMEEKLKEKVYFHMLKIHA